MSAAAGVVRVALVGAGGRMGRFARVVIEETDGLELVLSLGRGDDVQGALREVPADVGLDFTAAGLGARHAAWMLAAGLSALVGTSGVQEAELASLDAAAREVGRPALVVPNLSLGALLLEETARALAPHFPACEIVERHHDRKRDAPSATALSLARAVRAASADAPGAEGTEERPVPIHSVRLPGLYAHHELTLGAPGETLTLRHDVASPEAFRPGLVRALGAVGALEPGVHVGLGAVWRPGERAGGREA